MSPQDKKSLEEIVGLFLDLEKSSRDFSFDPAKLELLKEQISNLKNSSDFQVGRLADSAKHLTADMTLKHFSAFCVPFERALSKVLQDDDFLILENDKTNPLTEKLPLVFVLDNLRSAFNVGSILRTAECLNIEKVVLCGYTPLPTETKTSKTAMGTQDHVTWIDGGKLKEALIELKSQGYRLVALETAEKAKSLYSDFPSTPTAFILGNERFGLDAEVLKLLDEVRIIPLRGTKNSLNVGVTAAVAGFEFLRQWKTHG